MFDNSIHKISKKAKNISDRILFNCIQIDYKLRIKKLKNQGLKKLRIGFLVSENQLWNCQSLYDLLEQDEHFDVEIIALPDWINKVQRRTASGDINYQFFCERGMRVTRGFKKATGRPVNFLKLDFHVLFIDQPATIQILEKYRFSLKELAKKYFLCYVPYGYKVADGGDAHFNLPMHNCCWRIFAESAWHYQQFKKHGKVNGKNVTISGFPKLDEYLNEKRDYSCWKTKFSDKKRVIWAPHWTFRNPGWSYSTFDINYKEFLQYAKQHEEIDWIVKPHQNVFTWAVETGLMTEEEVCFYFESWNALPNASVNNEGNYMEIFKTSDALITDCGSFLAEYLPSGKPVLHLFNEESHFNQIGDRLIRTYYRCHDFDETKKIIERVILNGDDYKMKARRKIMKYVRPNEEGAGRSIFNELIKIFF